MIDYAMIVGFSGMCLILLAYFLNLFHRISVNDTSYLLVNIAGCAILLYYGTLFEPIAWPIVFINAVWGVSAVWKLLLRPRKTRRAAR